MDDELILCIQNFINKSTSGKNLHEIIFPKEIADLIWLYHQGPNIRMITEFEMYIRNPTSNHRASELLHSQKAVGLAVIEYISDIRGRVSIEAPQAYKQGITGFYPFHLHGIGNLRFRGPT